MPIFRIQHSHKVSSDGVKYWNITSLSEVGGRESYIITSWGNVAGRSPGRVKVEKKQRINSIFYRRNDDKAKQGWVSDTIFPLTGVEAKTLEEALVSSTKINLVNIRKAVKFIHPSATFASAEDEDDDDDVAVAAYTPVAATKAKPKLPYDMSGDPEWGAW